MAAPLRGLRTRIVSTPRRQWWGLVFIAPATGFFMVFMLYPMLSGLYLSLTDFTLLKSPTFVGLDNFRDLLEDHLFVKSASVTLKFVLGSTVPVWVLSLAAAVLFFQTFRGRDLLKAIFFLPVLPSLTVISIVWLVLLHPTAGVMTSALKPFTGLNQIRWLRDITLTPLMMVVVNDWATIPFYMLIWLAGLAGIPPELREAALVDGASRLTSFLRVELPLLRPTAVFVAALSCINAFQAFNLQYVLAPDRGGPVDSTTTFGIVIWKYGFQYYRMGDAAAVSVILFAVILAVTLVQLWLGRSEEFTLT